MWTKTHSKFYPNVSSEDVWKILIDINNWHKWHEDLEYCKLEGEFKVGSFFRLKPKGVSEVKVDLIEIKDKVSFTDCTTFFGAKMFDTHTVEVKGEGVILTNKVVVTGLLQWVWVKIVAQNVADTSLQQMDDLIKLLKER